MRLIVLGSTGSIGTQTLEVVEHLNALHARGTWPTRYEVVGLAAGRNWSALAHQAARFGQADTAICDPGDLLPLPPSAEHRTSVVHVRTGRSAAEKLVREVECDVVLAAMSGVPGLPATLAAVQL